MPSKTVTPSKPAQTPETEKVAEKASSLVADVKSTLEYVLSTRTATVKVNDTLLTFKKWGLNKKLTLGVKVNSLFTRISSIFPDAKIQDSLDNAELIGSIIGMLADDIMEIIARSMSDPFANYQEAYEWLDDECTYDDLVNLGIIVWEMNLKGEELGKFAEGLGKVTGKINALMNPAD